MSAVPNLTLPFELPGRPRLDPILVTLVTSLLCGGLIVLASASVSIGDAEFGNPFHYVQRQLLALAIGGVGAIAMLLIPTVVWQRLSGPLVLLALGALALVLVPGVGLTENGATRWISVAGFTVQVSDPARFALILYVAGYLVRRAEDVNERFAGFLKPMIIISLASALLLAEPDFGAATVLVATTLAMLFIGGARLRDFMLFALLALGTLAALAVTSPYRLARMTSFLRPWDDPFNDGFQLTQSLIAIGRGEWFGVGLGASVQKLFYLPEAHTDFVFAVLAEEFGLLGSIVVVGLFLALVLRIFSLSRQAAEKELWFQAYAALGVGVWLGLQSFINLGVNMGILPTKGLTLPLVSYGRSSLIMTMISIGLILRIHHEVMGPATLGKPRAKKAEVRR